MASNRVIDILIKYGLDKKSIKQVEDGTLSLEDAFKKVERQIKRTADESKKSSQVMSTAFGTFVGVALNDLKNKFIELGQKAIQAFTQITKESVNTAKEFEVIQAVITGIFAGAEEPAKKAFEEIRKSSRKLGVDLGELSAAFLPFVKNLNEFEKLAKLTTALAISQPEQGAFGARIALQEALSGGAAGLTSLQRRFELPKSALKTIQDYQKELGEATGLIVGLEKVLQDLGRDLDSVGGTFQLSLGRAQESLRDLQAAFGEPILDKLKSALDELGEATGANFEDLEFLALKFGDIVANIVDFVSSGILESFSTIDISQVEELANKMFDAVDSARTFVEVLSDVDLSGLIDGLSKGLSLLDRAFTTAAQLEGLIDAAEAQAAAQQQKALELGGITGQGLQAIGLGDTYFDAAQQAEIAAAGEEAYRNSLLKTVEALKESSDRKEAHTNKTKESTKATREQADAILELNAAEKAAAQAADNLAQAEDQLLEIQEKRLKIQRDLTNRRIDSEIENSRQKEKLELDNQRSIEDAGRKHNQRLEELAKELGRDRAKIEQDVARRRAKIDIDLSEKRIDIERDYQRRLRDIQKEFTAAADEAILNQDVQAFLQAQRDKDRALEDAALGRKDDQSDASLDARRQRDDLKIIREQELEDARIANRQRLDDLRLSLEQELQEIELKRQRDLDDQLAKEEQKREDLAEAGRRQLQEFDLANQEKTEKLTAQLEIEKEIIENAEKEKTKIIEREAKKRSEAYARERDAATGVRGGRPNDPTFLTPTRRASGGYASAGIYELGEAGREFVLNAGTTSALEQMLGRGLTQANVTGAVNRSYVNQPTININGAGDPALTARMVQRQIEDTLMRAERGY